MHSIGMQPLSTRTCAKNVKSNTLQSYEVSEAANQVKSGTPMARALAVNGNFPRLALQMVNVGEETGKLDEMLLKVADTYDREGITTIARLMALLVPALHHGRVQPIAPMICSVMLA